VSRIVAELFVVNCNVVIVTFCCLVGKL